MQETTQNTSAPTYKVDIYPLTNKDVVSSGTDVTALLAISVGMEYHTGPKFEAICRAIINAGYKKCTILRGCTLQRYNKFGMSEEEAHYETLQMGEHWEKENKKSIDLLKKAHIEVTITPWDEALTHPDYEKEKKEIDQAYGKKNGYTGYVNGAAFSVVHAKFRSNKQEEQFVIDNFEKERVPLEATLKYIREESAVIRTYAHNKEGKIYAFLYPIKGNEVSESVITAIRKTLDNEEYNESNLKSNLIFCDLHITAVQTSPKRSKNTASTNPQNFPTEQHQKLRQSQASLMSRLGIHAHSQPAPQEYGYSTQQQMPGEESIAFLVAEIMKTTAVPISTRLSMAQQLLDQIRKKSEYITAPNLDKK